MGERPLPYGGWLINSSDALSDINRGKLAIAFPKSNIEGIRKLEGKKITFYAFKSFHDNKNNKRSEFVEILNEVKPDIVHIYGTEYSHSLEMVKICEKQGVSVVVSIQGLVSVYSAHFMSNLPYSIMNKFTVRDFIKQDNLCQQQKRFFERGKNEKKVLEHVEHVIGRTTWDKACSLQINPTLQYHHCNEILRSEFYGHVWDVGQCERHSIFISQGSYPIKGLHLMLEAMSILFKQYSDVKLYVGGEDLTKTRTLGQKLRITSYGKYIKKLIHDFGLQDKVEFSGALNEKEMCQRYLKSHVFVCSSSIENSPNSMGEAMMIGVPSVVSNVGGVVDLFDHGRDGYAYQWDAPYMLAYYISEIFKDDNRAMQFSKNSRKHAAETHACKKNTERLLEIYESILK